MEARFPAFRNRKFSRRADYMPLESDSDADTARRSTSQLQRSRDRPQTTNLILCDKCWIHQVRSRATKRCLDCSQYLCKGCANCDEVVKPWWVPKFVLSCWRFMFTDTPHRIVDLQNYGTNDDPHWAHRQEASHIQDIPGVNRSSLRSKGSNRSDEGVARNRRGGARSVCSEGDGHRRGSGGRSPRGHRRLQYSISYDGKPRRSLERRVQKASTPGPLATNYRHDDIERLRRYRENWERAFDASSYDYMKQMPFRNKLIGKDVMIELSDKEAKVVVNAELEKIKKRRRAEALAKKRAKAKLKCDEPMTEQVFEEVPIWFKKPKKNSVPNSSAESTTRNDNRGGFERSGSAHSVRTGIHQHFNGGRPYGQYGSGQRSGGFEAFGNRNGQPQGHPTANEGANSRTTRVDYIVEEPPDPCPICLEDLPGVESRMLSCSHVFHTKCLKHLLANSLDVDFGIKCPVCSEITVIKNYYTSKDNWLKELPVSSSTV